jgi:cell division protein FtsL
VPAPAKRRPAPKKLTRGQRIAALPHSPFMDRLLTGRGWIVLVGVLLVGIVFVNVSLLEMNAGIAKTSEQVSTLKRENARLRLQAARLGSTERIQKAAADIDLVLPAPGQVRYLKANPAKDPANALKRMTAPVETAPVVAAPVVAEPAPVEPVVAEPAPVVPETAPVAAEPAPVAAAPAPVTEPTG